MVLTGTSRAASRAAVGVARGDGLEARGASVGRWTRRARGVEARSEGRCIPERANGRTNPRE